MSRQKRDSQRGALGRVLDDVFFAVAMGFVRVIAALPGRWIPWIADRFGDLVYLVDARGRRIGHQNLSVVFGDEQPAADRRRILRGCYRHQARALTLLLHVHPLTPAKYARWADVPDIESHPYTKQVRERGAVLVSGHIGNWELLLGLRVRFPDLPPTVFVAETVPNNVINRLMTGLRAHGDVIGAMRKGGATLVTRTVQEGGIAAVLVDRNVRGRYGGIFAPFLGLPARTTPLPAWLALRNRVPLHPLLLLPTQGGRYRLWLGPDLTPGLAPGTMDEQMRELTTRINHVMGSVILAWPELWNWTLARWKSRPTAEQGRYPRYSSHDPDRHARA